MKLFLSILSLALWGQILFAQEKLDSLGLVKNKDKTIFLYKGEHDGRDSLVIFNGEKSPAHFFVSDSSAHPLKRVTPLQFVGNQKVFIVSVWGKGAHGETVRVLDPEREDMVLFSFNSSWPVALEIKDNALVIKGKGEALGDETYEYRDLIKTWAPPLSK